MSNNPVMHPVRKQLIDKGLITPNALASEPATCDRCARPFERIKGAVWHKSCGFSMCHRVDDRPKGTRVIMKGGNA